jgi:hypothetical protein
MATKFFSTAMPASADDKKWHFVTADREQHNLSPSLHDRDALWCSSCSCVVIPGHALADAE